MRVVEMHIHQSFAQLAILDWGRVIWEDPYERNGFDRGNPKPAGRGHLRADRVRSISVGKSL